MSKLKFNATHRVLVKANEEGFTYRMLRIDVNNGTFYRDNDVDSDDTKIRVNKGIFAEKLGYNGNKDYHTALSNSKAQKIVDKFNARREELGFEPVEFYRVS